MKRGELLCVERRPFWHDEDKLGILTSVGIGGAGVTQVAQRHEITRQQIYAWRHDLKQKGLWSPDAGTLFLPLEVPVTQLPAVEPPQPTEVELSLRGGRCLHFDSAIDSATQTSLIRAAEAV